MSKLALVQAATRDQDFWLERGDRDIILLSFPYGSVAFRVDQDLLAEHSGVFLRTFEDACPGEDSERVYGCPVVSLNDPPHDLREILRLIYLPRSPANTVNAPHINLSYIFDILRLADKYEISRLDKVATGHLKAYYTTSFDAWDDGRNGASWQPRDTDAIRVINLARRKRTSDPALGSILPTAFYICATLGPDLELGCPLEDGSREKLSPGDCKLAGDLKSYLILENTDCARPLHQPPNARRVCPWKTCCRDVWAKLFDRAWFPDAAAHPIGSARPLSSWTPNMASLLVGFMGRWSRRTLCNTCRDDFERRDRRLRRRVWVKLPQLLGFTVNGCGWPTE